jgi:hypothetical protein
MSKYTEKARAYQQKRRAEIRQGIRPQILPRKYPDLWAARERGELTAQAYDRLVEARRYHAKKGEK